MSADATEKHYIHVRARTACKKESVVHTAPHRWAISVREKATQGNANRRIREVLADALGVPVSALRLIKGATMPSKTYLLSNPK